MDTILIVDDEPQVLESQRGLLEVSGYQDVVTVQTGAEASAVASERPVSLLILDLSLKNESGLDTLRWFQEHAPDTMVLVVTGAADLRIAVECMRSGAYDFLVKSADTGRLPSAVRNALEHRSVLRENARLRDAFVRTSPSNPEAFAGFVTVSDQIRRVFTYLDAVAELPDPVLITGETGVGKEVVARAIHSASGRQGSFVAVNIGGLDDHAVSDTLFGHVRGAFTGANTARDGVVRTASEGTLFLDELSEMTPESQVKLLRLLDSGEFFPLGSDRPQYSRARIVMATNRNLEEEIDQRRFRRDLYFRIASHHVRLPALRERPEDIAPVFRHLVAMHAERLGRPVPTLPAPTLEAITRMPLPGNVRELQQIVIAGLITGEWPVPDVAPRGTGGGSVYPVEYGSVLPTPAEAVEALFFEADRRFPGNRSAAAASLGLSPQAFANRWRRLNGRSSVRSAGEATPNHSQDD